MLADPAEGSESSTAAVRLPPIAVIVPPFAVTVEVVAIPSRRLFQPSQMIGFPERRCEYGLASVGPGNSDKSSRRMSRVSASNESTQGNSSLFR